LNRCTIVIYEQKNKCVDTLPLNQNALNVLMQRNKYQHGEDSLVFFNTRGKRILTANLWQSFQRAVQKSGIRRLRFHDLRHTFATRLAQSGVDLLSVQKLGRWRGVKMVIRYAHHSIESLRAGVEVMDGVRGGFSTNLAQSQKKGPEADPETRNLLIIFWLGDVDSNHDSRSQSPLSCR